MPDMYNLPAALDLSRLLVFHSVLGCITSVSFGSPSYNLPIALFGLFVSILKNSLTYHDLTCNFELANALLSLIHRSSLL